VARTWCVVLFVSLIACTLASSAGIARALPSADVAGATPSPAASPLPSPTAKPDEETIYGSPAAAPTTDPSRQPPAGIATTKETLDAVLRSYRDSYGPRSHTSLVRLSESLSAYGETGTYTEIDSGDDYVATTQIGPATYATGKLRGQRWAQNENGLTNLVSGVHQEEDVTQQTIADAVRGINAGSVRLLGVVTSPVSAYVVEVAPEGGRLEWLFIDTTTGRLVRREASRTGHRLVWTYDDFRTTDGITTAWHSHYSDGYAGNDVDRRTTAVEYDKPVAASELAIPSSRSLLQFPAGESDVKIPARFDGGVIIVRLTINGRGLDFQFDSGAAGIVLDADVARDLGLTTFGQRTAATAGTYTASKAIVPQIQIGDLTMKNVEVNCLPFNAQPDRQTKIVGLLGYDFIAGAVVKVDYQHATVDAFDPASFAPPKGHYYEMPIKLDDRQPMVSARLGDAESGAFIVDTGAFGVLVFPPFVNAHRQDLSYEVVSFGSFTFMPLIFSGGVGGEVRLRPMIASAFHFADVGFDDFEVFEAVALSDFQGEDNDGLIGYEFLQYFNVYFDYKDSMLLFEPNSLLTGAKNTGS
jgi:hypothetical protein